MGNMLSTIKGRVQAAVKENRLKSWRRRNKNVSKMILRVRESNLTYLSEEALKELCEITIRNEKCQIPGVIIEAGCALGGSLIAIAAAKEPHRKLMGYDCFGMIPPPSERDDKDVHERYEKIKGGRSTGINGEAYYGYRDDLYNEVLNSLDSCGLNANSNSISLIKGLFEDTLDPLEPISLAHIDCDWYDSVYLCLNRIVPKLVRGGVIVLDDYFHWSGCQNAVDDYLKETTGLKKFISNSGRLHISKT